MILTLQYLDPWHLNTPYSVEGVINVSGNGYGKYEQSSRTKRNVFIASVTRTFSKDQVGQDKWHYFESFYRTHLVNGSHKFKDSFVIEGSIQTKIMRFMPGSYKYNVNPSGMVTLDAEVEIFNAFS